MKQKKKKKKKDKTTHDSRWCHRSQLRIHELDPPRPTWLLRQLHDHNE